MGKKIRKTPVQSTTAVSVLTSANDESRKCVFEEGGLEPLLRIVETGSMSLKEKAAAAVEAITADPENVWAVSAYGDVSVLIEACRSGSLVTQVHAVGAISNVAIVEDIRNSLAEGAVPVVIQVLVSGTSSAQEKAANCIAILASSGEYFCACRGLMHLIREVSNSDTLEHVLRALSSLSGSEPSDRALS